MQIHRKSRRRSVTISVSEQTAIRTGARFASSWCRDCAETVNMVKPDLAAIMVSVSVRTLYQWIEAGTLHYSEEREGTPLVCLNSLASIQTRSRSLQSLLPEPGTL